MLRVLRELLLPEIDKMKHARKAMRKRERQQKLIEEQKQIEQQIRRESEQFGDAGRVGRRTNTRSTPSEGARRMTVRGNENNLNMTMNNETITTMPVTATAETYNIRRDEVNTGTGSTPTRLQSPPSGERNEDRNENKTGTSSSTTRLQNIPSNSRSEIKEERKEVKRNRNANCNKLLNTFNLKFVPNKGSLVGFSDGFKSWIRRMEEQVGNKR